MTKDSFSTKISCCGWTWVGLEWGERGIHDFCGKVILNDPKIDLILDLLQVSGGGVLLVYPCV